MNDKKVVINYMELLFEGISVTNQKFIIQQAEDFYCKWNEDADLDSLRSLAAEQQRLKDAIHFKLKAHRANKPK